MNATHDWLLHLDDANCKRFHKVHDLIKSSKEYKSIEAYFLKYFGSGRLEELVNWSSYSPERMTAKEMVKLCGFIQWSRYQNLELTFVPNEVDEQLCLAAGDGKLFFNSYGHREVWKLAGYEFLNQILEFIDVLESRAALSEQPFFNKHFSLHYH